MFSWWANSTRTLIDAHEAGKQWLQDFYLPADGLQSVSPAGVEFTNVHTGEITMATGIQSNGLDFPVSMNGTAGVASMPQDVALVVTLKTAIASGSARGRFYLPVLAVNALNDIGKLDVFARTGLMNALDAAWAAYNVIGTTPVVYSRKLRTTNDVINYNIGDVFDMQTRRDNKVEERRLTHPMAA